MDAQCRQATTRPTQATTPTAAPAGLGNIQPTHGTPHLGGPISDFIGEFGNPNDHSTPGSIYHFLRATTSNVDGLIVSTLSGGNQVDGVTVQATNGNAQTSAIGWTPDDAKARCMTFALSDAHFKQQFVYADNSGYDLVYTSAELARTFPASEFSDGQGNTVQAGLFDVSYLYTSDGQHIDSCDMITGEQQTTH